jgi:hypothetical protein
LLKLRWVRFARLSFVVHTGQMGAWRQWNVPYTALHRILQKPLQFRLKTLDLINKFQQIYLSDHLWCQWTPAKLRSRKLHNKPAQMRLVFIPATLISWAMLQQTVTQFMSTPCITGDSLFVMSQWHVLRCSECYNRHRLVLLRQSFCRLTQVLISFFKIVRQKYAAVYSFSWQERLIDLSYSCLLQTASIASALSGPCHLMFPVLCWYHWHGLV